MKLYEFIRETIRSIKAGIDKVNQELVDYKAGYPSEVEFDIALTHEGNICEKNESADSRLKFTMHLSHYPWQKENE